MNYKDKLATGRLMACNRFRYFRTAIMALVPRETPGLGTFGVTEDMIMLYDPKVVEEWTVEEIAAVIIHEVSHVLRGHAKRARRQETRAGFTHGKWNKAADYEINDDLIDAKLKLPSFKKNGVVVDEPCIPQKAKPKPLPVGLTAEEYLNHIPDEPENGGSGAHAGAGGKGKGQGQSGQGQGKDPHVGCGWCGGGAGHALPNEPQSKGKSQGRGDAEQERIKRTVAEEIRKAVAQKGQGTVPGGWVRWAENELKPPKVRWQDKLARVLRGSIQYRPGAVDYHYTKPSRRQAGLGWGPGKPILPAMRAPIPRVVFVQDTSGSMGSDELSAGLPEADAILKATGATLEFCACDADVHVLQKVRHWKELLPLMKGGGGTDFRPAFDAVLKKREKPDLIVFSTDGYGTFPTSAPACKVVWLVTGASHLPPDKFPFGEVVEIDGKSDA